MPKRVRAVIIQGKKILLIKRTRGNMVYWVVPGGMVEGKETNEKALQRECFEELGVKIEVKDLILEMNSKKPENRGQKELFYLCKIKSGRVGSGQGPEIMGKDFAYGGFYIKWKKIKDLLQIDFKPKELGDWVIENYLET